MTTTVMITGATAGIGLLTARRLAERGCHLLLHGRDPDRLAAAADAVRDAGDPAVETFQADLSRLADAERLAADVRERCPSLDVLINNAGVFRIEDPLTADGLDARFSVNTISPYLLTQRLLPILGSPDRPGRVVNVSSAAQAPVRADALAGAPSLSHGDAYAQSKLALTMWSHHLGTTLAPATVVVAVNPGSLLATRMVKEGFGIEGNDVEIGADILTRAALDDEFADAGGAYYDNDAHRFAPPHPDALDLEKCRAMTEQVEEVLARSA